MNKPMRSMVLVGILTAAGSAYAQPAGNKDAKVTPPATNAVMSAAASVPTTGNPSRDTLARMQRPISINFAETPLQDVMKFIAEVTGADMEPMWQDDQNSTGLEKEKAITLKAEKVTALALLEKVLDKATNDLSGTGGNTWQMSESGTLQCGPKSRLNKFRRVEIYPVRDLLMEIPNYGDAPEFDLQSVLQSSGGRGSSSSQSPFKDNGQNGNKTTGKPLEQRVEDLQKLLTELVEPEQWVDNGGEAATIRFYQNTFIVNAPDYVHRQLNGYPYWSQRATKVSMVKGHRYVTMGVDTALAGLSGIANQPVTGKK
jgi:hypothetical protein